MFAWLIINIFGISYVIWYAKKVKANPKFSYVYEEDEQWRNKAVTLNNEIKQDTPKSAWLVFGIMTIILLIFWLNIYKSYFEC